MGKGKNQDGSEEGEIRADLGTGPERGGPGSGVGIHGQIRSGNKKYGAEGAVETGICAFACAAC